MVKGNSGEACTTVVTEYHYHPEDHFDIRVEVFSENELEEQLRQLLQSYRHFHMNHDMMDGTENADSEPKAQLALDTFHAMFGARGWDKNVLLDGTEEFAMEKLKQWADKERPSDASLEYSGLSLEDILNRLNDLLSKSGSGGQPSAWPFVKCVK